MRILIQEKLEQLPLYQYAFLDVESLRFHNRIRVICREECPYYGSSWSCPPAVGRLEKCKAACRMYKRALFFSSFHPDEAGPEERRIRRRDHAHDELARKVEEELALLGIQGLLLTGSACSLCAECAFPRDNCRHPDKMRHCIESAGLNVSELAEAGNMDVYLGEETRLSFSILFFNG